jgi:hypothetical protein
MIDLHANLANLRYPSKENIFCLLLPVLHDHRTGIRRTPFTPDSIFGPRTTHAVLPCAACVIIG